MGMARPTPDARKTCPPTINPDTTQPGTALPCGPRRSIHRVPPAPPRQRAHPLAARWFDAGVLADRGAAMSSLIGADLYDWIGLRRVNGGRVVKLGERWLQSGYPVADYVAQALSALHTGGFITLTPDLRTGVTAHASLTPHGTLRYQQLCHQRQTEREAQSDVPGGCGE
jgi:hypothetical protein